MPVPAPVPVPTPVAGGFEEVLINCGGDAYTDTEGRIWEADQYFTSGKVYTVGTEVNIMDTVEDPLYRSERYGEFTYEIPLLELGDYQVILHFAEIYHSSVGARQFDVLVEGTTISNVDIVEQAGGGNVALKREVPAVPVTDGSLSLQFLADEPMLDNPKISAIEVKLAGPHLAHSVPGVETYIAVDTDGDGVEDVQVDGSQSHTHGFGLNLISWVWKEGSTVIGTTEVSTFTLPVGDHTVSLRVEDNDGNSHTESTMVSILPGGFPEVISLSPDNGNIVGGDVVTIAGIAFETATSVRFGQTVVTDFVIVDSSTITVISPNPGFSSSIPVEVSVITTVGESNSQIFTYNGETPIDFNIQKLMDSGFGQPASVAFGPDGKLYIGTNNGKLAKVSFANDSFTEVAGAAVVSTVDSGRFILGIDFDPLDTKVIPTIYCSSSKMFQDEEQNCKLVCIHWYLPFYACV